MPPPAVEIHGLVAGPLWGAGASWLGRRLAARRLVARLPEMLVAVTPERT